MAAARHKMPPEIASLSLDEIAERYIGRFRDNIPDWEAFEDAKIDGYRRAQHRFIGAGGSGKHDDPRVIPPRRAARPLRRRPTKKLWHVAARAGRRSRLRLAR